ncbi:helix-turn-helix domain-containing protein [Thiovibrio sp. JS02]
MMTVDQDNVLTIEELAVYLKISKSSLYKLAQKGEVPGQKVGKHWRFRRDIIDQWMAESTSATKRKDEG